MSQNPPEIAGGRRRGLCLAALLALLLALPAWPAAQAQGSRKAKQDAAEEKQRSQGSGQKKAKTMRNPRVAKALQETHELMDQGKDQEALAKLAALQLNRVDGYDKAMVLQYFGFVYFNLDRDDEAMAKFKEAIDLKELDETGQLRLEFNLAQLYMQAERYQDARQLLESWMARAPEVKPEHHYLLALAYYKLELFDKALEASLLSLQGEEPPKKGWLQLALALYIERDDYKNGATIAEQLAVLYPSKTHWLQLSAFYAQLERDDDALAVLQIAYRSGFLEEDREIRRLGRLFMNHDIPFRAAQVFTKALEEKKLEENAEAYELLAESWIFARELDKAIEPMRKAAELWKTGDLYVRLAQLHVERDDWKDAVAALDKAFEKDRLDARREGRAHLLLGVSHYNLKQITAAERAFRKASEFEDQREPASQWLKHLEVERNKGG